MPAIIKLPFKSADAPKNVPSNNMLAKGRTSPERESLTLPLKVPVSCARILDRLNRIKNIKRKRT